MRKSESIELIWHAFVLSVASVVQVGAFAFIYDGSVEIYETLIRPLGADLGSGMQSTLSFYVFGALAAMNAIMVSCVQMVKLKWFSGMAATAVWAFYWADISLAAPNRFFLIVLTGMMTFHIGILICDLMSAGDEPERSFR